MVSVAALEVLSQLDYPEPDKARITAGQLDRDLYEEVDEVLRRLGGKWDKRKRIHAFPYPVEALVAAVIASGELPPKNPTAYFPTPASLVQEMLDAVGVSEFWNEDDLVLEPSAGTGAIARAIRERTPNCRVHCCEVLEVNRKVLEADGFEIVARDFMAFEPEEQYDAVIMNPPFSLEGDKTAYITHVLRAWELLKPGGKLAAIVPPGWTYGSVKKVAAFREFVCDWLDFAEVGAGAFAESGTQVNTFLLWGEKRGPRTEPYQGWASYHAWQAALWIDNDQALYDKARSAKDMQAFTSVCAEAERELVSRQHVAVRIRPEVVQELWEHYQEG